MEKSGQISDMEKSEKTYDWFYAPVPSFPVKQTIKWFVGLLFVLLILGLIIKSSIITWLLFAGILVIIYFKFIAPYLKQKATYKARPADSQIDAWVEEGLTNLVTSAAKKFDIDEEDEDELKAPTFVICFPVGDAWRMGFDDKQRWAEWAFHLFFFKEDSILYYNGIYDCISGNITSESNERFFYKDIISPKSMREGDKTIFELAGTDARISYYANNCMPFHGKNRSSDVDYTVRAIEKLMHSSKYKTS